MRAKPTNTLWIWVAALGVVAVGCADCEFEVKQLERFIEAPANQVCSTDADCVVEMVPNCLEVQSAFCGQITLSRQASLSNQWRQLRDDAQSCDNPSCSQCAAALLPKCTDGACAR